MRKFYVLLSVLTFLISTELHAQVPISYYDFENNATRTVLETTVEQNINTIAGSTITRAGNTTTISQAAGPGVTLYAGTAAGSAASGINWDRTNTSDPGGLNATNYYTFTASTSGFTGASISFDYKMSSAANSPFFAVAYSTNGGTSFTSVTTSLLSTAWTSTGLLALGSGADDKSSIIFRIYSYDAVTAAAGATIDNLALYASSTTTTAGSKTLLNEGNIYTSYTSGSTGSVYNRTNFTVTGATTTVTIPDGTFLSITGAFTVSSSGTLNMGGASTGPSVLFGTGSFTLNSGTTLGITSTAGISNTASTGNIYATMTRSYNAGATYIYKGITGNQNTGTALPTNITGALTINNSSGATLQQATTVSGTGTLNLLSGIFTTTTVNTINVTNTATGAVTGGSTTAFVNGPLNRTLPASLTSSATVYAFPVGNTSYLPYSITSINTGATAPVLQVTGFNSNSTGTADGTTLLSISSAEYWQTAVKSGIYSGASLSLGRVAALGAINAIGKGLSTSSAATTYSSLAGTVGTLSSQVSVNSSIQTGAIASGASQFNVLGTICTTLSSSPSISSPICVGATTVTGTSTEVTGTLISVYANGVFVGSTSIITGGAWSATVSALTAGASITATASASGKCLSPTSAAVIVATSATPTITTPVCPGSTAISGNSSEANGTTINLFVNGTFTASTTVSANAWSLSGLSAFTNGQVITVTAAAVGKCTSSAATTTIVQSATPVVNSVCAGATSISGTSTEATGSTVSVYDNAVLVGTTTTITAGNWTVAVAAVTLGDQITATVLASGKCVSSLSSPVTVSSPTSTPTVNSPICVSATTVSGTTTEANGTLITVYVNGVSTGSTSVITAGAWSVAVSALAAGASITATAQASGQCAGSASAAVIVATSATPVVTAPVCPGATAVSGTSTEADGTTINLYVNGSFVVATTVTTNAWTITGLTPFGSGNTIYATAAAVNKCTSANSATVTVSNSSTPVVNSPICPGSTVITGSSSEVNGSSVIVYDNGVQVGSTTVISASSWSVTISPAVVAGDFITATVQASGKCISSASAAVTVQSISATPSVNSPICVGATSATGTSSEADGTTVTLYKGGVSIGTSTVTGGVWTVSGFTALIAGNVITATVQASGKCISAASASVTVATSAAPVVTSPICPGATTVSGTSTEANGTTINLFVNGSFVVVTTVTANAWTISGLTPFVAGNTVYATAAATNKCTSANSTTVTVATSATPVVNSPICPGTTVITGTSAEANGSSVLVYNNGVQVGSTTVISASSWSVTIPAVAAGQAITATVQATGKCISSVSTAVTVQSVSATPSVNSPICVGATSASGTSSEADGTTVTLYKGGVSIGSSTVTGGVWTVSGFAALIAGNVITATVQASGKCISAASASVTVATSATPVVTSPICPGATTVSGTSTEANGSTVTVYINGSASGTTTTISASAWTVSGLPAMVSGNSITATVQATNKCISASSTAVVITSTSSPNAPIGPLGLTPQSGGTTVTGTFSAPAPTPTGYIVIRTTSATPTPVPVDNTTYTVGSTAIGGTVISVSTSTGFTDNNLTPGTQYWYWVYSYNANGCIVNSIYSSTNITNTTTTGPCVSNTLYWAGAGSTLQQTVGTDWNTAANWSTVSGSYTGSTYVPNSCTDVVFPMTRNLTTTVAMSASASVKSVAITYSPSGNKNFFLSIGSNTLSTSANFTATNAGLGGTGDALVVTVGSSGSLLIGGNVSCSNSDVSLGTNSIQFQNSGTLTVSGTTTANSLNSVTNSYVAFFIDNSPAVTTFNGNCVFDDGSSYNLYPLYNNAVVVGALATTSTGKYIFNKNVTFGPVAASSSLNAATALFSASAAQTITDNMQIYAFGAGIFQVGTGSNATALTITHGSSTGPAVTAFSSLIKTGASLTLTASESLQSYKYESAGTTSGTLTVENGANLFVSGPVTTNLFPTPTGSNFPNGYTTYSLGATSTVEYNRAGAQTVYATPTYGNLTLGDVTTTPATSATAGGALTIAGDALINPSATFLGGTAFSHSLSGNWQNNGSFTANSCTVNFIGAVSKSISGSGLSPFYNFTLNKGSDTTTVVDVTGSGLVSVTNTPTFTSGKLRVQTGGSFNLINNGFTIASVAGLHVNGGALTVTNASVINNGLVRLTTGSFNMGTVAGNELQNKTGSLCAIQGGTYTGSGRLIATGGKYQQSGGTVTLCTVGNTSATVGNFDLSFASSLDMSGGSLIIRLPNTAATPFNSINITSGSGTKSFSGGTIQIGDASTTAGQTFLINSPVAFNNLTINSNNSPVAKLVADLTVAGTLTMNGGNIDSRTNSKTLYVSNSATGAIARTAGFVDGNLKRAVALPSTSYSWPVGVTTNYTPASYNFTTLTGGDLTVKVNAGEQANIASSIIDQTNDVNAYWTVTPSNSFASSKYTGHYSYPSTLNDIPASVADYQLGNYNTGWTYATVDPSNAPSNTDFYFTNGTLFGDQVVGSSKTDVWTGLALNNNWFDAGNWTLRVPASTNDAVIPVVTSNSYPIITTGDALAKNITIASGASTIVSGAGIFSLYGTVANSGTFNLLDGTLDLAGSGISMQGSQITAGTGGAGTVKNLRISNNSAISSAANDMLAVSNNLTFNGSNLTFTTHENLTLLSGAAGTASVTDLTKDPSGATIMGNTISGNASVQRYISNNRKWQLLSVNTGVDVLGSLSKNTVQANWMEGQAPGTSLSTGYGMWITGVGGTGSGFDFATTTPTVKYLDATNSSGYTGITNPTSWDLRQKPTYFAFVRGDRGSTGQNTVNNKTTLRQFGNLIQNSYSIAVAGGAPGTFSDVGNPLPSAIDLTKLNYPNSTGVNNIYIWDPNLTTGYGLGAFQTLSGDVNTGFIIVPGGGSYPLGNPIMNTIESGQGFFIQNTASAGTVDFSESSKTAGGTYTNIPFFTSGAEQRISATLTTNNGAADIVMDGFVTRFNTGWSRAIDHSDAVKLANTNESVSDLRAGKKLAVEYRDLPEDYDTVFVNIAQMQYRNYNWKLDLHNMDQPGREVLLIDKFTNTETHLDPTGTTNYNFAVTVPAGSYAADRFLIVFRPANVVAVRSIAITASKQTNGTNLVKWSVENELNIAHYELERSADAVSFSHIEANTTATNNAGGSAAYSEIDSRPLSAVNFYRVKALSNNGQVQYSAVVKVAGSNKPAFVSVYPNPVSNKTIHLVGTDVPASTYQVRVVSTDGKTIYAGVISVSGDSFTKDIPLSSSTAAGKYTVVLQNASADFTVPVTVLQ